MKETKNKNKWNRCRAYTSINQFKKAFTRQDYRIKKDFFSFHFHSITFSNNFIYEDINGTCISHDIKQIENWPFQ